MGSFSYNGFGDRVSQNVNNTITDYLLDPANGLTQVLGEFSPGDETWYLLGLDIIGQQSNGAWSYFGYDGLGSLRQMYDATGALQFAASYDPYGVPFEQFGLGGALGFTGEYTDANGLQYLRARFYNPSLGMFLNRDPIMGGGQAIRWNPYAYAGANPVNHTDPSGRFFPVAFLGGAVMGAAFDFFSQGFSQLGETTVIGLSGCVLDRKQSYEKQI